MVIRKILNKYAFLDYKYFLFFFLTIYPGKIPMYVHKIFSEKVMISYEKVKQLSFQI